MGVGCDRQAIAYLVVRTVFWGLVFGLSPFALSLSPFDFDSP